VRGALSYVKLLSSSLVQVLESEPAAGCAPDRCRQAVREDCRRPTVRDKWASLASRQCISRCAEKVPGHPAAALVATRRLGL